MSDKHTREYCGRVTVILPEICDGCGAPEPDVRWAIDPSGTVDPIPVYSAFIRRFVRRAWESGVPKYGAGQQ